MSIEQQNRSVRPETPAMEHTENVDAQGVTWQQYQFDDPQGAITVSYETDDGTRSSPRQIDADVTHATFGDPNLDFSRHVLNGKSIVMLQARDGFHGAVTLRMPGGAPVKLQIARQEKVVLKEGVEGIRRIEAKPGDNRSIDFPKKNEDLFLWFRGADRQSADWIRISPQSVEAHSDDFVLRDFTKDGVTYRRLTVLPSFTGELFLHQDGQTKQMSVPLSPEDRLQFLSQRLEAVDRQRQATAGDLQIMAKKIDTLAQKLGANDARVIEQRQRYEALRKRLEQQKP